MMKILASRWTLWLSVPLTVACVLAFAWSRKPAPGRRQAGAGGSAGPSVVAPAPAHPVHARSTPTLYLAAPKPLGPHDQWAIPSLLVRELMRQAVLVAARDGLGLTTRDGVLREAPPAEAAEAADATLRLDMGYLRRHSVIYMVYDGGTSAADHGTLLQREELALPGSEPLLPDLPPLVVEAERRSRGQYVQFLQHEGFHRPAGPSAAPAQPATGPADAAADVEPRLAELTEVAQFAALREAHAAIRATGETPQWLGVLARGYANLGQLTSGHWNASHDVFVARSLLYAQRMVAADPWSAYPRWHRAYALALAGLHKAALDDLAAADAMPHDQPAPSWVELLDPLCRYRTEKLAAIATADKARAPMAMFLCFLTVEHCGSTSAVLETAKAALEVNPLCMRLIDSMCRHAGVSYLHELTVLGPGLFRPTLARSLGRLDELPPAVRSRLGATARDWQDPATVATLCQSLADARDDREFSWPVLGRMLQEINFVHVETRSQFLAQQLGGDPAPYVAAELPLVEGHPFKPFIEALGCYSSGRPDMGQIRRLLKNFSIPEPRRAEGPAITLTGQIDTPGVVQGKVAWRFMLGSLDNTAWDQEQALINERINTWAKRPDVSARTAQHILDVSPHAPNAMALQIICDWGAAEPHVDEWAQEFPGHPSVNGALAIQYTALKQYDKAEPFFRAYLKKSPDAWAYRMLSDNYYATGDRKRWLATVNQSLQQEDYGLDHANTCVHVADMLMDEGHYKEALPYAESAGESCMSAGLVCAARCREGIGDWDKAEQWIRADTERYGRHMNYFVWCVRTGHGDRAAAATIVARWLDGLDEAGRRQYLSKAIEFHLLEGRADAARDAARRLFDASGDPFSGIHIALLELARGDAAAAQSALAEVERRGRAFKFAPNGQGRQLLLLAPRLRECLAAGPAASLDLQAVEAIIKDLPKNEQTEIDYFVARYLELRGNTIAAEPYFRRAAAGPVNYTNTLLALQWKHAHPAATQPANAT